MPPSHTPEYALTWTLMGDPAAEVLVPAVAHEPGDYVMVWDPVQHGVVYVMAPDEERFGQAWIRADGAWVQTHSKAVHVPGVQQRWQGFFDEGRGAVVAWSFAGGRPVGVELVSGGARLLAIEDAAGGSPGGSAVFSREVPSVEGAVGCLGIFAFDRTQNRTVCLTRKGLCDAGPNGLWRHVGEGLELPASVVKFGSYWDTPRARAVFWIWDGTCVHLYAMQDDQVVVLDGRGLPKEIGAGFVIGQDEQFGALLYAGPGLGAFEPWDGGWRPSACGRNGPPRMKTGQLVVMPMGAVLTGPGLGDQGAMGGFHVRDALRWRADGMVVRSSLLHDVRGSGGWPVMACASGRLFAVGWRQDLHTIHWTGAGWRGLVEPVVGALIHHAHSRLDRAAVLEGPGGALHAIFMDGAVFRLDGTTWTMVCGASSGFGPRFDLTAGFDGESLYVYGGDVGGVDRNDTLRLGPTGWQTLPPSPKVTRRGGSPWLVFDGGLQRMLRLGDRASVLGDDDVWVDIHVPGYAAVADAGFRPLAFKKELLLLCGEYLYRFDVDGLRAAAGLTPPGEARTGGDVSVFPFEPDVAFDTRRGVLYTCDRGDADGNWLVDLSAAVAQASALGPRSAWTPPAPRAWRYRDGAVWFATGSGPTEIEVDGQKVEGAPSLAVALKGAATQGWIAAEGLSRRALRARLGVTMHRLRRSRGSLKGSYLGGLPHGVEPWPVDDSGLPLGHLLRVALPDGVHGSGAALSVFVPTDGSTSRAASCVAMLVSARSGPTVVPSGAVVLPPSKLKVRKARLERDERAIDSLPEDPALRSVVDELGLKAPGGDKLGGSPEWVGPAEAPTAWPLLLQYDLDGVEWSRKQKKAWPDARLCGELYVFLSPNGPVVIWQET